MGGFVCVCSSPSHVSVKPVSEVGGSGGSSGAALKGAPEAAHPRLSNGGPHVTYVWCQVQACVCAVLCSC